MNKNAHQTADAIRKENDPHRGAKTILVVVALGGPLLLLVSLLLSL